MRSNSKRPPVALDIFRHELRDPADRYHDLQSACESARAARSAIWHFCDSEIAHQVRCTICRLQRILPAGIYTEWNCRSYWDEMCMEQFFGPGEWRPFMEPDVDKMIEAVVSKMPRHHRELLLVHLREKDDEQNADVEVIRFAISDEVWQTALNRGERRYERLQ